MFEAVDSLRIFGESLYIVDMRASLHRTLCVVFCDQCEWVYKIEEAE